MKPPEYKTGNASFRKALNEIVAFARRHGLNPAGAPGWRESADGWVPPGGIVDGEVADPRQWQLKIGKENPEDEEPKAQIRGGALYGLGFSGFNLGEFFDDLEWAADEWITLDDATGDAQVWLKLFVKVVGAPFTYYSSPDQVETVYLPAQVDESRVELFFDEVGDDPPEPIEPTIDPETGESDVEGEYYLRIGTVNVEGRSYSNDFLGPLGIGWCPPSGPYLVELTT
jgi:hypothetical protein